MLTHEVYLHAGNAEVNFHQANLLLSFSFRPPEAKQFCSQTLWVLWCGGGPLQGLGDQELPGGEGTVLSCCCSTGKAEVLGQPSSSYLLLAGVGKTFQATKIASDKLP